MAEVTAKLFCAGSGESPTQTFTWKMVDGLRCLRGPLPDDMTPEGEARRMLARMDIDGAEDFTSGDVVELANLISWAEHVAGLIEELLPPRGR